MPHINGGVRWANETVTITNFAHSFPDDVDMVLVGPTGANVMLMSDVGGASSTATAPITLTFSDSATSSLSDPGPLVGLPPVAAK